MSVSSGQPRPRGGPGAGHRPAVRTVADLMASPALTVDPGAALIDAAVTMATANTGSLVVTVSSRPTGILTERDLLRAAASGADPRAARVGEWMTPDPDCVAADVEVAEAWRALAEHGYRHIPVVVEGELKGIVSMRDLMAVAELRPVEGAVADVARGLKGVVVAETAIGEVRGLEGFYHYRQYSAVDVATHCSFEDAWQLLVDGDLEEGDARAAFRDETSQLRPVPPSVAAILPGVVAASRGRGPLEALRSALSLVASAEGFGASHDAGPSELRHQALRLSAVVPTLVAALYRLEQGADPVEPRPDLGYVANYLYMLGGEDPDPARARAIEQYLVLTLDHGFNSSTFTSRVVTSTGADMGSAAVAALGALSGPLHGGAPSRALDTLDAIGSPDRAEEWVRQAILSGQRIMGFGHAVYKTEDPRARLLRQIARELGGPLVEFAEQVESVVLALLAELKPGQRLNTNVEYYAGVVMEQCALPRSLFTPTFACSRAVGWCSHILEQATDNRIIRPSARYVGPPPPVPLPPEHLASPRR